MSTQARQLPDTPECDKLLALEKSGRRGQVQEFLDWLLDEQRVQFYSGVSYYGRPLTFYKSREELMADFFGLDLHKIDREREALLDYQRWLNDQAEASRG